MAELKTIAKNNTCNQWPVIVNSTLSGSELTKLLEKQFKMRVSNTTVAHSVIFPQSSIAFMIVPIHEVLLEWPSEQDNFKPDEQVIARIEKFSQLHRHCYLLTIASSMKQNEQQVITDLQTRFAWNKLRIIPVHSPKECMECMTNIAKVMYKTTSLDRSKDLEAAMYREDVILHIIRNIGLTPHEAMVISHGCSTISHVSIAKLEELSDCTLDASKSQNILSFFNKDFIIV